MYIHIYIYSRYIVIYYRIPKTWPNIKHDPVVSASLSWSLIPPRRTDDPNRDSPDCRPSVVGNATDGRDIKGFSRETAPGPAVLYIIYIVVYQQCKKVHCCSPFFDETFDAKQLEVQEICVLLGCAFSKQWNLAVPRIRDPTSSLWEFRYLKLHRASQSSRHNSWHQLMGWLCLSQSHGSTSDPGHQTSLENAPERTKPPFEAIRVWSPESIISSFDWCLQSPLYIHVM